MLTDTDSLCYEIKTADFYKDIAENVPEWFDTFNFDEDHPTTIPVGINKEAVGMMKGEVEGKQIAEFVGPRSKLYDKGLNCIAEDEVEKKKCKGVKNGQQK